MRVGITRRSDWLVSQLPVGMLDDDFLVRFTSLFEDLATSLLAGADNIPNVVDVDVTPVGFIPWLGSWIGSRAAHHAMDEALQRRLVHQASQGLAWRGTRAGLQQFLEVLTGWEVQIEESGGILREGEAGDRPPRVRIQVASTGGKSVEELIDLVSDEVPAMVTYELYLGDTRLWPEPDDDVAAGPSGAVPMAVPDELPTLPPGVVPPWATPTLGEPGVPDSQEGGA